MSCLLEPNTIDGVLPIKFMRKKHFILPFLIVLPSVIYAHSGATGVIKERMDLMSSISDSVKTISAMMKGKTSYDAVIVRQEAERIATSSGMHITMFFPENSLDSISEARPEIWQDWENFERYAMELEIIANGLALAAGNAGTSTNPANDLNALLGLPGTLSTSSSAASQPLSVESLSSLPPQDVFKKLTQNCSGCHKDFRLDKD